MCHTAQTDQGLRVYATARSVYLVSLHAEGLIEVGVDLGVELGEKRSGCGEGNHGTQRGRDEHGRPEEHELGRSAPAPECLPCSE